MHAAQDNVWRQKLRERVRARFLEQRMSAATVKKHIQRWLAGGGTLDGLAKSLGLHP